MTAPSRPTLYPFERSLGRLVKIALTTILVVFVFMFMMTGAGSGQLEALLTLLLGWLQFLKRTVPQISWNWDIIGMALLCLGMILFLAHRFLNWITRSIASVRGSSFVWPWKWTWCGSLAVALFFLVGMAVGGTAHQIGWIVSSEEPWYERKPRHLKNLIEMSQLSQKVRQLLLNSTTGEGLRKALWNSDPEQHGFEGQPSLLQSYNILLVVGVDGKVTGAILLPRSSESQSKVGGHYVTDQDSKPIPAKDLPELIRSYQGKLVAL